MKLSLVMSDQSAAVGEHIEKEEAEAMFRALPSECRLLSCLLDAVCAWRTGPVDLRFTWFIIPLYISIVDLPSLPVESLSTECLVKHWSGRARCSDELKTYETEILVQ
jgi:hypothetical protein